MRRIAIMIFLLLCWVGLEAQPSANYVRERDMPTYFAHYKTPWTNKLRGFFMPVVVPNIQDKFVEQMERGQHVFVEDSAKWYEVLGNYTILDNMAKVMSQGKYRCLSGEGGSSSTWPGFGTTSTTAMRGDYQFRWGRMNLSIGDSSTIYRSNNTFTNTAVGIMAGMSCTSQGNNSLFGYGAGAYGAGGTTNQFFGIRSGFYTYGSCNSGMGAYALYNNREGADNEAFGNTALYSNWSGSFNIGIGVDALNHAIDTRWNEALGDSVMFWTRHGWRNKAFGWGAGFWNVGSDNIFFGNHAGRNAGVNGDSVNNCSYYGNLSGYNNQQSNKIFFEGQDTLHGIYIDKITEVAKLNYSTEIVRDATQSWPNLILSGKTNHNQQLRMGYDVDYNKGFIQSMITGAMYTPLLLNSDGGKIGINTPLTDTLDKAVTINGSVEIVDTYNNSPKLVVRNRWANRIVELRGSGEDTNHVAQYAGVGTATGQDFGFFTSNVDRGVILSSGSWGIGTNDPHAGLEINHKVMINHDSIPTTDVSIPLLGLHGDTIKQTTITIPMDRFNEVDGELIPKNDYGLNAHTISGGAIFSSGDATITGSTTTGSLFLTSIEIGNSDDSLFTAIRNSGGAAPDPNDPPWRLVKTRIPHTLNGWGISSSQNITTKDITLGIDTSKIPTMNDTLSGGKIATKYEKANTVNIQTFTYTGATTTWTMPTGAKMIEVHIVAGGGGGGSGRKGAAGSVRCGGGGGSGGGYSRMVYSAAMISSPVTLYVAGGGTGGVARTADNSDGATGNNGEVGYFGPYLKANYGYSGSGGTATTGTGGASGSGNFGVSQAAGTASVTGGAGVTPANGGYCGSGAAGAGLTTSDVASNGASGGVQPWYYNGTTAGGSAGTTGGTLSGGNGIQVPGMWVGTGGGSGASSKTTGTNAGAGGVGFYGGGGGGGGASQNGASNNSGAGGNGGSGVIVVITYF